MVQARRAGVLLCIAACAPGVLTSQAPQGPQAGIVQQAAETGRLHAGSAAVATFADGSYALLSGASEPGRVSDAEVLRGQPYFDLSGSSVVASDYPHHTITRAAFRDALGAGTSLQVANTGLSGRPDLLLDLRMYDDGRFGAAKVTLRNSTSAAVQVHALGILRSSSGVHLGGPDAADRVLSDSFSEDSPPMAVKDLAAGTSGLHRGFGSQLIYNRTSGRSLFFGALTASRFITMLHLQEQGAGEGAHIVSYDIASTGTQEGEPEQSALYPASNNPPLLLSVAPGESLGSEPVLFSVGDDYHAQLQNYGEAVRVANHARTTTPTPIGWWSWTAYYYDVTQGSMLTNAEWLSQNLRDLGYKYFQIDEGYQYARGEYATPDVRLFPRGVEYVGGAIRGMGLTFGVWVAPFQVSERSWVYQHHPEWLVHTRDGQPEHIGKVNGKFDNLYALDTTHPGAQEYLRYTYGTLVHQWGVRFIKMDFMDSSSVEGVFHKPNTTALEAQRIGLEVIRSAVGDDVVLDKDGSPMLTPVGIVDAGRTSQDTGHTFGSTHDAATGVIARYYMNRKFYITDPDAFTISKQVVPDRGWHGNKVPLTQEEADASIALSAVSGGMFEIGDDLPTLGQSAERLALVHNMDLINMARFGHASTPLDLMTYAPEDQQPSILLLHESARRSVLTVFNWTAASRAHTVALPSLGLSPAHHYTVTNLLHSQGVPLSGNALVLTQPAHSVRMFTIVDTTLPQAPPEFTMQSAASASAGEDLGFTASTALNSEPVVRYLWSFGDGVSKEGERLRHTYTVAGHYTVTLTAIGIDGLTAKRTAQVTVKGFIPTLYDPAAKQRPADK